MKAIFLDIDGVLNSNDHTAFIKSFITYGNSNEISDLCLKKFRQGHEELEHVKKFADSLKTFTTCIETSRGKIIPKEGVNGVSKRMGVLLSLI